MNLKHDPSHVFELVNVTKVFGADGHKTQAVQEVCLGASPGELVLLLGPSGSGKTTLLTLIAGLMKPTSGSVIIFGKNVEEYSSGELQQIRAKRIGFVFQTFLLIDSLTVSENVALVLRFAGESPADARRRARRLLRQFGIEHLAQKFPDTLSQGEKQRAAVARALANEPALVIADEPTASLESKQGFDVIQTLLAYAKQKRRCVVVASHDLRIVQFADRVLRLEDGRLVHSEANVSDRPRPLVNDPMVAGETPGKPRVTTRQESCRSSTPQCPLASIR
ncbi:MAG TPA: ABC transporter ATP-binding protein [Candidatus Acidoferrales bacterium]|nr:ABC transporter ATP-binding protein [Candidatus Acidoferrales bacterium]